MIDAHVTLTLLVVTVLKKHVHMDVVAKNVLGVVLVTAAQDPANVQMDILVLLVNAPLAQMVVVVKVLAIQRLVCAAVLVDTLEMIAVHVYAQKGMIH
jgi:hypothetical protein